MRFGSGAVHGGGMRYGGSAYWISSGPLHYYTMEYAASFLPEVEIEEPGPPELNWTKMNTGWNKKRGRK